MTRGSPEGTPARQASTADGDGSPVTPWDGVDGGRPVRRLAEALREITGDLGLAAPADVAAVMREWPAAVGTAVAAHVRPRRLHDGILFVDVDDPAWATQLRWLEGDIVRRLGRTVRPGVVTGIQAAVRR